MEILYEDDFLVAVDKPNGLLVHRTSLAKDATQFAMQLLRDQIGIRVYPVHRLDRKTSGVLLFAKNKEINSQMQIKFADRNIRKEYLAIVRGYTLDSKDIDYPLRNEKGISRDSKSSIHTLQRSEIPISSGKYASSRYSLIRVIPLTGRMHQIRKHMAHINHPIIGDRPYGCNKQNKFFKSKYDMRTMLLHASALGFQHPIHEKELIIEAQPHSEFRRMVKELNFELTFTA